MNAHRSSSLVGQRIGGYELSAALGGGPHGQVFLATHPARDTCVVKVFDPHRCPPAPLQRCVRLNNTLAALPGTGACPIDDAATDVPLPFIAREYLGGESLESLRRRHERVPWSSARPLFAELARCLDVAHRAGYAHGNLKPTNVRVVSTGGAPSVRLLDWGLAQPNQQDEGTRTDVGALVDYQAREVLMGGPSTPASDRYALGVLLFELLTGQRPFRGNPNEVAMQHMRTPAPSPRTLVQDLSADAEALVLHLLHKDPRQRHLPSDWLAAPEPRPTLDEDAEPATSIFVRTPQHPARVAPSPTPTEVTGELTVIQTEPGRAVPRQPETVILPSAAANPPPGGVTLVLDQMQGPTLLEPDTERSPRPTVPSEPTIVGPQSPGTIFMKSPALARSAAPAPPQPRRRLLDFSAWSFERKLMAVNLMLLVVIFLGVALFFSARA